MTVPAGRRLAMAALCLGFSGCTLGQDEVLFVTNTNVGINLDSKPPAIGIGYDREEGYIGPSYGNGALAPVVSRISSNLSVFTPEVHQVYATGEASKFLASASPTVGSDLPLLTTDKRTVFFMTESSAGLKVSFVANAPESIHFGYRRKELSYIPLGHGSAGSCATPAPGDVTTPTGAKQVDCYGSVLATIDVGANVGDQQHTGMQMSQLFATGRTAELLAANNEETREIFKWKLNLESGLTAAQLATAKKAATDARQQSNADIDAILSYVAPKGVLNTGTLAKLVDDTDKDPKDTWPALLKQKATAGAVQSWLTNRPGISHALAGAIPKKS